ncbi:MAG: rod-binding protein [Alphaproteobacteria bacterium]|nr:rod-binding protein [Alphaproteobacteria bacterium]
MTPIVASGFDRSSLASARLASTSSASGIDAAAKDFESMFMAQMLQPMWEGLEVDGMFGGGHGEEAMRGLLVQEYGKAVALGGHLGLSDSIKAEMIRMQASAQKTGAGREILIMRQKIVELRQPNAAKQAQLAELFKG